VSVGATQVARLTEGAASTRAQGVYGGMLTLGGVVGFLTAPALVDGVGLHAVGGVLALPGIAVLWRHRAHDAARPAGSVAEPSASADAGRVLTHPVVLAASLCYVAIIASYVTLSTFVTSYYAEIGILGPLNAFVLLTATVGRMLGGVAVYRLPVSDAGLAGAASAVAAVGFGALAVGPGMALVVLLPVVAMLAVSVPFGATYAIAADATPREGSALATMVAVGNVAALVVPAVTGALRDATGTYAGGFAVLAVLNVLALAAAVGLAARGDAATGTPA